MKDVFITGGTGYIGTRLIKALQQQGGYRIRAIARKTSAHKLPIGCEIIEADALVADTYKHFILANSIFIHLVGVPHPSPSKKEKFKSIDLRSIEEACKAAVYADVSHFIYLSVAQYPSRIMKEYQLVRLAGENLLKQSGLTSSFIRPWYVLGPGHWWPVLLIPFYKLLSFWPATKEIVTQQGLVTLKQMVHTLLFAVRNPPAEKLTIYTVPDIKKILSGETIQNTNNQ